MSVVGVRLVRGNVVPPPVELTAAQWYEFLEPLELQPDGVRAVSDWPAVRRGKDIYTFDRQLAKGGYGVVAVYRADPGVGSPVNEFLVKKMVGSQNGVHEYMVSNTLRVPRADPVEERARQRLVGRCVATRWLHFPGQDLMQPAVQTLYAARADDDAEEGTGVWLVSDGATHFMAMQPLTGAMSGLRKMSPEHAMDVGVSVASQRRQPFECICCNVAPTSSRKGKGGSELQLRSAGRMDRHQRKELWRRHALRLGAEAQTSVQRRHR